MSYRSRPLPPEIYRRRRVAALVILVVLIAAVSAGVWAVAGLVTSSAAEQPAPEEPAAERPLPTMIAARDGEDVLDEEYDRPFTLPAPDGPEPRADYAEGPCRDENIAVEVTMDRHNFAVGDQPRFVVVITNTGTETCARDLGPARQEITVRGLGGEHVWSNTDCAPGTGRDAWTLSPDEKAAFAIIWTGTLSNPTCSARRDPVAPGQYEVVARLGGVESPPAPIVFHDPE